MFHMRKLLAAASMAVIAAVGISNSAQSKEPFKGDPSELYIMNVMVSGVEYWFPVYEMFKQAGQQLGVKTKYTGTPEYDVNKQLATFEQALALNPAGIFVHPMNPDPFIEPINRATAMGIPVVTFAADSPNSKRVAYVTSDNFREGSVAADTLAKAVDGKGEYAILENPGQDNHDKRVSSFIDRMKENWPDMKLVARAATNQDPNRAYQAVLSIAQAHPNIDGIWMPEASSALGAAQAAQELGGKIRILNADVNAKILDMLKDGKVFASINPNQGIQGYLGMMMLYMARHSDLIDPMNDYKRAGYNPFTLPVIDNGFAVVNKDNAEDFYWDKYLKRRGTKGIEE